MTNRLIPRIIAAAALSLLLAIPALTQNTVRQHGYQHGYRSAYEAGYRVGFGIR